MQPACVPLRLIQGATFRDTLRLSQPTLVYKAIQAISAVAPVRLAVPEHGLSGDWPVWVRSVQQWPEVNREPHKGRPWQATRVDADTLEINALSAVGQKPVGGQLIYQPPVDLTGCSARMQIRDKPGGVVLLALTVGAGLELDPAGTLRREITAEQTAQLSLAAAFHEVELTFADGAVLRWAEGPVELSP
ncbi:hypothetical protein [Metapseudomonas resinovorans]|uniref:hypothetical protein n=1 Tax=Metapseudomonas resinovorans TaxID=53412 RepID=UPI00041AAE7D|nr:hypothetical protein [Pseudomonas resinovorans]